ncbi:hypothetical protein PTKIN_Ptkin18bG0062600 [Pterospermum kingtungense]
MQKVEDALEKGPDFSNQLGVVLEDDPEYQLIVDCNALSVDIENEILQHRLLVAIPLPEFVLQKTIDACDRALAMDTAKKKVLDFVESRMRYIAFQLYIVGSAVAAKLMGAAGGVSALVNMPACNVQLLGAKKKALAGFSTATSQIRVGYIEQTDFSNYTPALWVRACRLLASKATLADPKPLPVPDSVPKKRRGGRRLRKMKDRYGITERRKLQNMVQFGVQEESSLGDGLGEGYGMLGQAGSSGKLRALVAQSKLAAKVAKKFKDKHYGSSGGGGGGATSGLTSSLAFTPVQGIELANPQAHAHQLASGTQSTCFSETGTFSKIKRT